jgi:hypothetical protein
MRAINQPHFAGLRFPFHEHRTGIFSIVSHFDPIMGLKSLHKFPVSATVQSQVYVGAGISLLFGSTSIAPLWGKLGKGQGLWRIFFLTRFGRLLRAHWQRD